jgi:cobalt/nickel transport system permease protein
MTAASVPQPHGSGGAGRIGWLEQTLAGITANIEQAIFTEHNARSAGWLQRRDPRAKIVALVVAVLAAGLATSVSGLAILYAATLAAARASRVPFGFFVKRVWLGIPFFAGIVVVPAIFFVPVRGCSTWRLVPSTWHRRSTASPGRRYS